MAIVDLVMPKMGESIMEATILKWYKRVGDHIQQDETLLDIATDKVDSEVPSSVDGTISEILYNVNDVVAVGSVIARVQTSATVPQPAPVAFSTLDNELVKPTMPVTVAPVASQEPIATQQPAYKQPNSTYTSMPLVENTAQENIPYIPQNVTQPNLPNNNHFFSPLVLNIANSEGISLSELEKIKGTGEDGRVSKKDVLQYVPENANASKATGNNRFFSPLVLNIANSEGLTLSELDRIEGTGADGRVSKKDVLQYVADKKAGHLPAFTAPVTQKITESAPQLPTQMVQKPLVAIPAYVEPIAVQAIFDDQPMQPIVIPEPVITMPIVEEVPPIIHEPVSIPEPVAVVERPKVIEPIAVYEPEAIIETPKAETAVVAREPVAVIETPEVVEPIAVYEPKAIIETPKVETPVVVPEPVAVVETPKVVEPIAVYEPKANIETPKVETPKVETPVVSHEPVAVVETPKVVEPIAVYEQKAIIETPKVEMPVVATEPAVVVETQKVVEPIAGYEQKAIIEKRKVEEPVATEEGKIVVVKEPNIEDEKKVNEAVKPAEPIAIANQKQVLATSINQTCIQPVQQSVFVPNPIYSQDIPLSTLAEGETGKFANPTFALPTGDTEIIEMDRMRKLIAKHMVNSVQTSPHVTSFVEADVTNMVLWRNRVKNDFERREGTKITFTPMFIECLVKVMKQFPLINSSINGDSIVLKKDFNIGMATALPSGNLIVPVIKSAEKLNIVGLSKAVNNMATAARNSQLKPDDTSGGTFTFTNVGTFGSLMGTPIINQPQVAILAVGVIKKRPVVIESAEGDTIGIRHMMYLSLSYDHRVIDGSIGASFLSAVAKAFEQWDVNRTWYQYT